MSKCNARDLVSHGKTVTLDAVLDPDILDEFQDPDTLDAAVITVIMGDATALSTMADAEEDRGSDLNRSTPRQRELFARDRLPNGGLP